MDFVLNPSVSPCSKNLSNISDSLKTHNVKPRQGIYQKENWLVTLNGSWDQNKHTTIIWKADIIFFQVLFKEEVGTGYPRNPLKYFNETKEVF